MFFFINFKAYRESTGSNAVSLIRGIEREFGNNLSIVLVLNPLDSMIDTPLTKFAQTAEPLAPGPYTGHIPLTLLKNYGYSGVMLNHSEFRLEQDSIVTSIKIARESGLKSLVCAANIKVLTEISRLKPDFLAYEPPELIGGNVSVSSAKPEIIERAAEILKNSKVKLVVGAGIKNANDIRISRELGASGILVSSGVVKSKEPIRVINQMMEEVA